MSIRENYPVIDLTHLCNYTNDDATGNAVVEMAVTNDLVVETPRGRRRQDRRRNDNNRAHRSSHVVNDGSVRIINDEPIVINDSPLINTEHNNDHSRVARVSKNRNVENELTNTVDEVVRDRSPLGLFAICPICLENLTVQPLVSTKCGHAFCRECLIQALRVEKLCPMCRKPLRGSTAYHPLFLNRRN